MLNFIDISKQLNNISLKKFFLTKSSINIFKTNRTKSTSPPQQTSSKTIESDSQRFHSFSKRNDPIKLPTISLSNSVNDKQCQSKIIFQNSELNNILSNSIDKTIKKGKKRKAVIMPKQPSPVKQSEIFKKIWLNRKTTVDKMESNNENELFKITSVNVNKYSNNKSLSDRFHKIRDFTFDKNQSSFAFHKVKEQSPKRIKIQSNLMKPICGIYFNAKGLGKNVIIKQNRLCK